VRRYGGRNAGPGHRCGRVHRLDPGGPAVGRGPPVNVVAAPRLVDLARSGLDPRKAEAELGWRARVGLAKGVARTVAYFRGLPG